MSGRTVFALSLLAIGLLIAADALFPLKVIQLVLGLLVAALGVQEFVFMRREARQNP